MSKSHNDNIPMGKNKPKFIHHGRRSLDKLLPNYLTPSNGSCHDKCKYGCRRVSFLFSSSCTKPIVDSIARRTNQAKKPMQMNPEPWRMVGSSCSIDQQSRRRLSEFIDPKRYRHIGRREDGGLESTGKLRKKSEALPEVSRTVKSSSSRLLKKQNSVAKAKSNKRNGEHVQEMTLHVVEQKDESDGDETCTDSSSSNKESFEKQVGNQNFNPNATKKSLREIQPERKSIVVTLRHRSVEAKQGSHNRSYNSLIEDTTHGLVWVNKSKVKALVNAFEHVISLNNSRPWK